MKNGLSSNILSKHKGKEISKSLQSQSIGNLTFLSIEKSPKIKETIECLHQGSLNKSLNDLDRETEKKEGHLKMIRIGKSPKFLTGKS